MEADRRNHQTKEDECVWQPPGAEQTYLERSLGEPRESLSFQRFYDPDISGDHRPLLRIQETSVTRLCSGRLP